MPYCSDCGKRFDGQVFYCPACGGPMQFAPPPPRPGAYTQQDQVAFGAAPLDDGVDERFLNGCSWGPGCQLYFYSHAMLMFFFALVVLEGIMAFFGDPSLMNSETKIKATTGQSIVTLLSWLASIGVFVWACKVARRRRWTMQRWRDFEHFRKDEQTWNIAGIIGWVFIGLFFIIGVIAQLDHT